MKASKGKSINYFNYLRTKETTKDPYEIKEDKQPFSRMLWGIARVALPASITMVFSMLMDLVNMIFVGHLDDSAKIAGIGLGNMYVNIVS